MIYLLDSNVFISSANLYYCNSFCPGFWEWIIKLHNNELFYSIKSVRDELVAQDDELSRWVKKLPKSFFLSDEETLTDGSYGKVVRWASTPGRFKPHAVSKFLDVADSRLVAFGMKHDATIVTNEKSQPRAKKRILIPNACDHFEVSCLTIYELLRELNPVFCYSTV